MTNEDRDKNELGGLAARILLASKAENYQELHYGLRTVDGKCRDMIITIQYRDKKTAHEMRAEVEMEMIKLHDRNAQAAFLFGKIIGAGLTPEIKQEIFNYIEAGETS